MEVHPHTHTERKKITHYLWEFFMLFMAVTLGFFVENQREKIVERHRGSQYIHSFVEDLTKDTANFSNLLTIYKEKVAAIDDLFNCYDSVTGKFRSNNCLINITDNASGFPDLIYTDRTLQQLKNAGGLRLLDPNDADSITSYDNDLRTQEKTETTEVQETQTVIRSITYDLVNFPAIKAIVKNHGWKNPEVAKTPFLYDNNNALLNKYFNALFHYGGMMHSQLFVIKELKDRATSLISYFKKKHHFK